MEGGLATRRRALRMFICTSRKLRQPIRQHKNNEIADLSGTGLQNGWLLLISQREIIIVSSRRLNEALSLATF